MFFQNSILSFWSRGEAKPKLWYNAFIVKTARLFGSSLIGSYKIIKVGSLRAHYDYNLATYEEKLDPDAFLIQTRYTDYIGRCHDRVCESVGRSYVNRKDYEFKTQADAISFLLEKTQVWPMFMMYLGLSGLVATLLSLVLDIMLFDFFFETLLVGSVVGSVCLFLFGGRAMFDVKKKFESIDKVIKSNEEK
ncbi:MAG: hypothetical protein ACRC6R_07285 [Bacteroidales bacterium]